MKIVVFGLSLSSSWGNGHATTYRALTRGLHARGHRVVFFERDAPWYAEHRDLVDPDYCDLVFYRSLAEWDRAAGAALAEADAIVLGSYVPEGVALARRLLARKACPLAFYDIDTPVTLAKLRNGDHEYLAPDLIPAFDLYLSFTGGPVLNSLVEGYGARLAVPLYCGVDVDLYRPTSGKARWDLGYLGTYSADRQPTLERLLIEPARRRPDLRFIVAGPQYPAEIDWPENVDRLDHVGASDHAAFFAQLRFTLNVTRAEMVRLGYSPSVRLFEAAACGVPIISDSWMGLSTFFTPPDEILLADSGDDVLAFLTTVGEAERRGIGEAGRRRALRDHSAERRAIEFEAALAAARSPAPQKQAQPA